MEEAGIQSDLGQESSTLDSEIDALSKIITDASSKLDHAGENTFDDNLLLKENLRNESVSTGKTSSRQDNNIDFKNMLRNSDELDRLTSSSSEESTAKDTLGLVKDKYVNSKIDDDSQNKKNTIISSCKSSNEGSESKSVSSFTVNNSLAMLSEAYSSHESQDSVTSESSEKTFEDRSKATHLSKDTVLISEDDKIELDNEVLDDPLDAEDSDDTDPLGDENCEVLEGHIQTKANKQVKAGKNSDEAAIIETRKGSDEAKNPLDIDNINSVECLSEIRPLLSETKTKPKNNENTNNQENVELINETSNEVLCEKVLATDKELAVSEEDVNYSINAEQHNISLDDSGGSKVLQEKETEALGLEKLELVNTDNLKDEVIDCDEKNVSGIKHMDIESKATVSSELINVKSSAEPRPESQQIINENVQHIAFKDVDTNQINKENDESTKTTSDETDGTSEQKETSTNKNDEVNSERKETSTNKKDEVTSEQKETSTNKKDEVTSEQKETSTNKKDEVTSEQKEISSDEKDEVTSEKKEISSGEKDEVTSEQKEISSDEKDEVTSEQKEVSSDEKDKVPSEQKEICSNDNCKVSSDDPLKDSHSDDGGLCHDEDNDSFKTAESDLLEKSEMKETPADENCSPKDASSVDIDTQDEKANLKQKIDEYESEDRADIDLSLDPEETASPLAQNTSEDQMTFDNFSSDLFTDVATSELEKPIGMETDLSKTSNSNQMVDDIIGHEQLAFNNLNEEEKHLNPDIEVFSKAPQEATNENLGEYSHVESPNSSNECTIKQPQDSSTEAVSQIELVSTECIRTDEKVKSEEKDEDISLTFEESSQSSIPMENDTFVRDLYNNCVPDAVDDTNEGNIQTEKANECNKQVGTTSSHNNEALVDDDTKSLEGTTTVGKESDSNVESKEISELESAVKFLQESEKQDVKSTKISEEISSTGVESSNVFVSAKDVDDYNSTEPTPNIEEDDLEAEIISEAAKLETERLEKLKLEQQLTDLKQDSGNVEISPNMEKSALPNDNDDVTLPKTNELVEDSIETSIKDTAEVPSITETKEKQESPESSLSVQEQEKASFNETSETPTSSLQVPVLQHRLSSPELDDNSIDSKLLDTPKKDLEKQQQLQYENVGSPRIILKIAKSALADCSEPRSPKSPKIRSATNSPAPDENSAHKLNKIKLKLSKGGHPSIIPNAESTGEEETKDEPAKRPETSLGMKIKLSKSGDASIIQQDSPSKELTQDTQVTLKKLDSPSNVMKFKLSKCGDASIIPPDVKLQSDDQIKEKAEDIRTESPIGMKIKLSKSGDASVISNESSELTRDIIEPERTESPMGSVKIKLTKTKDGSASIIPSENVDDFQTEVSLKKTKSLRKKDVSDEAADGALEKPQQVDEENAKIGMKFKLSKSGDASIVHDTIQEPIGMKIKLTKTGDPSIVHPETPKEVSEPTTSQNIRIKHGKHKDHSTINLQKSKEDSHLEMKIKLSKTGHPTIITPTEPQKHDSPVQAATISSTQPQMHSNEDASIIKALKKSHSDVTIEPIKVQPIESTLKDLSVKRKDISIAPIEIKKSKLESDLSSMFPEVTLQPIVPVSKVDPHQAIMLESKKGGISQQQMNVINREISITQVSSSLPVTSLLSERLKSTLSATSEASTSSPNRDIITQIPQPELIIVNEGSNSSQDVMIIEEVPPPVKIPKKRGRPRKTEKLLPGTAAVAAATAAAARANYPSFEAQIDPLSLDSSAQLEGADRPRRTCRSQKSYAPPKRGRGRGRGKRKIEALDIPSKRQRIEQDLTEIEESTTALISIERFPTTPPSASTHTTSELFRALNQPTLANQRISTSSGIEIIEIPQTKVLITPVQLKETNEIPEEEEIVELEMDTESVSPPAGQLEGSMEFYEETSELTKIESEAMKSAIIEENWIAPTEPAIRGNAEAMAAVMDEETRMSAESGSRSHTPARNVGAAGASETLLNEESQGSTATTESEKVQKVRQTRRMEVTVSADDGPCTVEKIAEYDWPCKDDLKPGMRSETFMIQEQISQYLGVKSFKRKYPDLKRRMVDMEERNYLREHALVSESLCDLGLTAVSSAEVLDIMCTDFPEQYEEYRKYIREKAIKEHAKKQKELLAAANAERSRMDLAEMAMHSTIHWNTGLNKARLDSRQCSLDLQTFTVHMPKRPQKFDPSRRSNNVYPCALIPGQYSEYYREYTSAELRYFPLNTVVYGPTRPNERKFDSQSDGSQSDSDSDSSSDGSSSSSSEDTQESQDTQDTQDTDQNSQTIMDEVDIEIDVNPEIKCKLCSNHLNKANRPETLIVCGKCGGNVHPSCIDLTLDMVPHIRAYSWQCTDCKTCAQCHDPADEDKMLFCDMCDRGYHIYCVGLRKVPQGRWHCVECAICANCGVKDPAGFNGDRNSVALWQHEYKKGEKSTVVYVSTYCVPCSKLRGNHGRDH